MGIVDRETTTPPEAELGAESEIDVAVSKVFAAETIPEKIDQLAVAMQVTATNILRGARQ